MNIPQFLKNAKSGDFLTTKYGNIICVQRVEVVIEHEGEPEERAKVCVYFYFDYDPNDKMFMMNEWLRGFYGPKFDDQDFYRPSTAEEIKMFKGLMDQYGYELDESYGEIVPSLTSKGFDRIRKMMNVE